MPRRKLREIEKAEKKAIAQAPEAEAPSGGTVFRQALCPVCGTGHSYRRELLKGNIVISRTNYWDWERDPEKPFGVIFETSGRGTLRSLGYFSPQEDPDGHFERVKRHLLAALREWRDKGWISDGDIKAVLTGPPGAPIKPVVRKAPALAPALKGIPPPGRPLPPREPEPVPQTLKPIGRSQDEVEALWQDLVNRIRNWKRPNTQTAERLLDAFVKESGYNEGELDLQDLRDLLEAYKDISPEDYGDREEYSEAKFDAWQEFLNGLDDQSFDVESP